jgi:hypothetical protein
MKAIASTVQRLLIATIAVPLGAFSFMAIAYADDLSLREQLEKLVPHASGIALVEVVDVKEVDARPRDGPLSLVVNFKLLRATGTTMEQTSIVKAKGGTGPPLGPNVKPAPPGPVTFDTFKKGGLRKNPWVV